MPIIRLKISECPVLKGRTVQQVYDKIRSLQKKGPMQDMKKVEPVLDVTFEDQRC